MNKRTKPGAVAIIVSLLLAYPAWLADLKFAALGAIFTAWVIMIIQIGIDYAKAVKDE